MVSDINLTNKMPAAFSKWDTFPRSIAIFLSALNIFLFITASLGNILILIALHKVSSIFQPTKLLFRCLAVTDLCVGLISHPVSAFLLVYFSIFKTDKDYDYYIFVISHSVHFLSFVILSQTSVLTSAAISVDRLLALLLGLRYRHVVTLRRVRAVIVCSCSSGILSGVLSWYAGYTVSLNKTVFLFLNVIFYGSITIALVTSICSYMKIFFKLRRQQAQQQGHTNSGEPNGEGNPLNNARYKKTVCTVAWVQLTLFVCYAPFIIMAMRSISDSSRVNVIAFHFVTFLVDLNSSLNPIIYCWRIRDVRQQVRNILRKGAPC